MTPEKSVDAKPAPDAPSGPSDVFLVVKAYPTEESAKKTVDLLKKKGLVHGNYPKVVAAGTAGLDGGPYAVFAAPTKREVADAFAGGKYEVVPVKGWPDPEDIGAVVVPVDPWNSVKRSVEVRARTSVGCGAVVGSAGPGDVAALPPGDVCLVAKSKVGAPDALVLTPVTQPVTKLYEARFWSEDDAAKTGVAPKIPWRAAVLVAQSPSTEADPEWNANHEWLLEALAPFGVAVRYVTDANIELRPDLTVDLDAAFPGHSENGVLMITDAKSVWIPADEADHATVVATAKDVLGVAIP